MKHPREYDIYRPHEGECPPQLVGCASGEALPLDFIRIVKDGDLVVGAYRFERVSATAYHIVAICVTESRRGQGLGRWLLTHAIGVIESKGGRTIEVHMNDARKLFVSLGFKRFDTNTLKLEMVPD